MKKYIQEKLSQKIGSFLLMIIYLCFIFQVKAERSFTLTKICWNDGVHFTVDGQHVYVEPEKPIHIKGDHEVIYSIPDSGQSGFREEPVKPQTRYKIIINKSIHKNIELASLFPLIIKRKEIDFNNEKIILELKETVFQPSEQGALNFLKHIKVQPGEKVLDVGTGSGILAIGAAKQGGIVYATDIHKDATNLAKKNAKLNEVKIKTSTSSYFANFNQKFDVIIANLPNEIIPPVYAKEIGGHLTETIHSGNNADILINFLDVAPIHMHEKSRLYMCAYGATNYKQVLEKFCSGFNAKLLEIKTVPVKDYVGEHISYFKELLDQGSIILFKEDGIWKTNIFFFELKKL